MKFVAPLIYILHILSILYKDQQPEGETGEKEMIKRRRKEDLPLSEKMCCKERFCAI